MDAIFGLKIDSTLLSGIYGIVGVLFGVISGGFITYRLNVKQMKKSLVLDLQIKASQEMLKEIDNLTNSLLKVYNNIDQLISNIELYNKSLIILQENNQIPQPKLSDVYAVPIEDDFVKMYSKWIENCMQNNSEKCEQFSLAFNSYWNIFESREVILNKFTNIYHIILKESDKLIVCRSNYTTNYHMNISSDVMSKVIISEEKIDVTKELWEIYKNETWDFIGYLRDFKIELQNYFYSDLFDKYKVKRREPEDKNVRVLTIDSEMEE